MVQPTHSPRYCHHHSPQHTTSSHQQPIETNLAFHIILISILHKILCVPLWWLEQCTVFLRTSTEMHTWTVTHSERLKYQSTYQISGILRRYVHHTLSANRKVFATSVRSGVRRSGRRRSRTIRALVHSRPTFSFYRTYFHCCKTSQ